MSIPLLVSASNPLPCSNQLKVIQQIQPTIELLRNLNADYPDILKERAIEPEDYHDGLVFRSAIESIRGSYIASSTPGREKFVEDILKAMKGNSLIYDYDRLSSNQRWDFEVFPDNDESYLCVIEVKGGEGNSVNISVRSRTVKEFAIWSHLDGSIQHPPSKGAKAVVGRITNELSARGKQVDILLFRDVLCGTRARPCPKYPGQEDTIGPKTCPDIFLFPQRVPTIDDPEPPVHNLETLRLPKLLLQHFEVPEADYPKHIWSVNLRLEKNQDNRLRRIYSLIYQGNVVVEGKGKPFSPNEQ
ncbi:MAG: hypothetical protein EOP04_21400 [Proteobacteria bacterium]|nr:MAG: hypothetical protein EOP04_21400 [Pseudomonadota bacterium]